MWYKSDPGHLWAEAERGRATVVSCEVTLWESVRSGMQVGTIDVMGSQSTIFYQNNMVTFWSGFPNSPTPVCHSVTHVLGSAHSYGFGICHALHATLYVCFSTSWEFTSFLNWLDILILLTQLWRHILPDVCHDTPSPSHCILYRVREFSHLGSPNPCDYRHFLSWHLY